MAPNELELADDDLRTTKSVHIVHQSNYLSPIKNRNSAGQKKVNSDIIDAHNHLSPTGNPNSAGQ